jgi:hypothetical protein
MEKYYATKYVQEHPFRDHLMLNMSKSVYRKILSINITTYSNSEMVEDDNIEIIISELLLSEELDELNNAINSYENTGELATRYNIEINTMNRASDFGNSLVQKFASNNIYRGKHITEIERNGVTKPITSHIVDEHLTLIVNMLTGSLTDVYRTMSTLPPDELITQEELDEFKRRLEIYLGV